MRKRISCFLFFIGFISLLASLYISITSPRFYTDTVTVKLPDGRMNQNYDINQHLDNLYVLYKLSDKSGTFSFLSALLFCIAWVLKNNKIGIIPQRKNLTENKGN